MRIIGGQHRGRRFFPPKKIPARPTTDIAKEGLFNILENSFDFDELNYLDLFAGTGSLSFEFGSRGCLDITSVERHGPSVRFIRQTAKDLDLPIQVFQQDVFRFIKNCETQYDLIFAGPPYPLPTLDTIPGLVQEADMIKTDGFLILEHNPNHNFDDAPGFVKKRNYGTTIFSFFAALK